MRASAPGARTLEWAVGIDVGGSHIAAGRVSRSGALDVGAGGDTGARLARAPLPRSAPAEEIFAALAGSLTQALSPGVVCVGIGFPGPFDYDRGISLLTGGGKFDALYGMDVGAELRRRTGLPTAIPIRFVNDAFAFAIGECRFGAGRDAARVVCVTLGTGCGSAFVVRGRPVTSGPGVPENGWIYNLPVGDRTVDDVLSGRGVARLWREMAGAEPTDSTSGPDAAALARMARAGDGRAIRLFHRFGATLGEILAPHLAAFGADALVVGGGVARSFDLFAGEAARALERRGVKAAVRRAEHLDEAAILGAAAVAFEAVRPGMNEAG